MKALAIASAILFCIWQSTYAQKATVFEGKYLIKQGKTYESTVLIQELSDGTINFSIEAQKGPPSYNSGSLNGSFTLKSGGGKFYQNEYGECHLKFTFTDKTLKIEALEDESGCGFGNGVYVAGTYKKVSSKLTKREIESLSSQ
jgi:hypothetical protein